MKRRLILLIFSGLLLLAAACRSGLDGDIRDGERKWDRAGITSYEIDVMEISIWHAQTHHVIVQDGQVLDATADCTPAPLELGECEVRPFEPQRFTVPGLFEIARHQAQLSGGRWTRIGFDEAYGFPSRISYDDENAIDEENGWRVLRFELTP